MDTSKLLALYDRDERREAHDPGMRREVAPGIVRLVDEVGNDSMVVYSHLGPSDTDPAIRRERAYFELLGHRVEWKLYAHDGPRDLHERLLAQGFATEEPDAIMALDLAEAPPALLGPAQVSIRRIEDADMLEDAARVMEAVWPEKRARITGRLQYLLQNHPARVSIYVAYVDGEPVSTARLHLSERSLFASLWGGATVPSFRGRGLYTALLAVRLQEAKRRGARFLTIDAGEMSRPIVEKFGFHLLTYAQAHVRPVP